MMSCIKMRRGGGSSILRAKRNEYGKQIRKDYERHRVTEKRRNITELEPRTDGLTNTITTVQKDNMLMEQQKINIIGDVEGLNNAVNSCKKYRIRKLTERECYRLMGFSDKDFEQAASVISRTQLYKTAGNSIVKIVLMAIFSQLGIDEVKKWNDMSEDEIYERIIKKTYRSKQKSVSGVST